MILLLALLLSACGDGGSKGNSNQGTDATAPIDVISNAVIPIAPEGVDVMLWSEGYEAFQVLRTHIGQNSRLLSSEEDTVIAFINQYADNKEELAMQEHNI